MFEHQTPQEQTFTYWKNPTEHKLRADVPVGPGSRTGHTRYTWEPGEIKPVPSEFDKAIRDDRGAGIVMGLAPQLEKVESAGVAPLTKTEPTEPRRRNLPPEAKG